MKAFHEKELLVVFCLSMILISQNAWADSEKVCDENTNHCYKLFETPATWNDAQAYCESEGAHLATITSQTENDFVYGNIGIQIDTWLGGTDANNEGVWEWVTEEEWTYSNWGPGEPNDAYGGQDYLTFWWLHPYTWDDAGLPNDDTLIPFICEWECDDTTDTDDNIIFDFPVGKPDGKGYNTRRGVRFLWAHKYDCGYAPHPGEDWNGKRGGNTDKDDPVWAVANGTIVTAKDFGGSWGNIVLVRHDAPTGENFSLPGGRSTKIVWSQYAHLGIISQNPCTEKEWGEDNKVKRGDQIGTIGQSGGQYHLHFEIRKENLEADAFTCDYYDEYGFWGAVKTVLENYVRPTSFIRLNR